MKLMCRMIGAMGGGVQLLLVVVLVIYWVCVCWESVKPNTSAGLARSIRVCD